MIVTENEYATKAVETHPDGWTAEISRTERSGKGDRDKVSALLVDVGLISHLIAMIAERRKSKEAA
jgi:hypothetical protein